MDDEGVVEEITVFPWDISLADLFNEVLRVWILDVDDDSDLVFQFIEPPVKPIPAPGVYFVVLFKRTLWWIGWWLNVCPSFVITGVSEGKLAFIRRL